MKRPLLSLLICLSLCFIPASGSLAAKKSEPSTSKEMHEEILANMPIYDDGKVSEYVNSVGQRIVKHAKDAKGSFTFTVIDLPDINAFAIQDGYIYINRGLITYLKSEAQLAAVLAHEVGHVTAKHHARQKRAKFGSNLAAGLLAVLTRSAEVGEASALWGASLVSGYGREMELEADELGGEYLYSANYDPQAMIEVVSLLKDHERLEKKRAQESGKKTQTYHGLFATHPRNDKRLREVVSKAGTLPQAANAEKNITPFRLATDGMIWGKNFTKKETPEHRFQHNKLAFRFDYPEDWEFTDGGALISGQNKEGNIKLNLQIKARTLDPPDQYIKKQLGIPLVKKSEPIVQAKLKGHTGFVPMANGLPDQRLVVLYYSRRAYVFRGEILEGADEKVANEQFLKIIGSFRPVSRRSLSARKPKTIHYVKATPSTTFASLGKYLKLGKYGEQELRIINGYYPAGEPHPGEWIKIIQ